ncbi:MAG: inorganic pyrophosphatase [Phototrophicales bacterium]|nr:MAG: inorganic pyrophosphatase [Phototrophicales bacterium]
MIHLWHALSSGPKAPDSVYAVVEVPKGSRNKYEYSKTAGVIKLDRVLSSPVHYPGDYGFIPQTYYPDNDPLDILVMMNEPSFPGCVIEARPVAMLRLIDKGQTDDKILAVPATDPEYDDYLDLDNLPRHFPNMVEHFFRTYKELERNAKVESLGWVGAEEAREAIRRAMALYRESFPPPGI